MATAAPGSPSPSIAIVGGGIGGLAVAAFLHRAGLSCTVYEQAPQLTEIGAGLVVAPNAARLLRRLGVITAFADRAVQLEVGFEFRRWHDGRVLSAEDLSAACERLYGEHTYTAHRADLLDVIRSAVPADSILLGQQCIEVADNLPRPSLRFANGETVEADIVIGADGMHSAVRSAVTEPSPATDSGICAFRALVPADRAPAFARRRAQTIWVGPGHHLVHYPVSAGTYVNLVAFAPTSEDSIESWTATATVAEFLAEFEGWDPRLVDLIHAAGTPGRWALLDRPPLPRWTRGCITLLGDAAHPMFPFFAQGAAQSLEDAAVLARCLADGMDDPATALQRYEAVRIPRTSKIQKISHARALTNHLPDGPAQQRRDLSFAASDPLTDNGWIYGYDPDAA